MEHVRPEAKTVHMTESVQAQAQNTTEWLDTGSTSVANTAELQAAKPVVPKAGAEEVIKNIVGHGLMAIGASVGASMFAVTIPLGLVGAGVGFAVGKGVEKFAKNASGEEGVNGALIGMSVGTLLTGALVLGGAKLIKDAYGMKQDRKQATAQASDVKSLGFKPEKTRVCQSGEGFVDATYENAKPENNCDLVIVNPHNGIGIVMDGAGHNSSFIAKQDAPVKDAFIRTFAEYTTSKLNDEDKRKELRKALRGTTANQNEIMTQVRGEDRKLINEAISNGQMTSQSFLLKNEIDKGEITKIRNNLASPKYDDLDRELMNEVLHALDAETPSQINALMNDPVKGNTAKDYLKLLSSGGTATIPAYVMIKVENDPTAIDGSRKAIIAQDGDCCWGSYDPSTNKYEWHGENTDVNGAKVTVLTGLKKGTILFSMSDGIPEFLPRSIIQDIVVNNSHQLNQIMPALKKAVIENDGEGLQASKPESSVVKEDHKCKKHDYNDASKHDDISGFFLVV